MNRNRQKKPIQVVTRLSSSLLLLMIKLQNCIMPYTSTYTLDVNENLKKNCDTAECKHLLFLGAPIINKCMKIFELLLERDTRKRNKMLFFRQTVDSILNKVAGKTIVVFDTETTGFSVLVPWVQVTEIAAVAIDGDTGNIISKFHYKVKLTPETRAEIARQKRNRKPESQVGQGDDDKGSIEGPKGLAIPDIFKMTKYGEPNAPFAELRDVYVKWAEWLSQFDKPVLLAQNAGFDMSHMFAPLAKLGIPRPKIGEVMDTLTMARTWIYPLLKAAGQAGDETSAKMAEEFETRSKSGRAGHSFTLGRLGKAFNVPAAHWHSGLSDAMQTWGIFSKMLDFLKHAQEHAYDESDVFKKWHKFMSMKAFHYGKRPAHQDTVDSLTKRGIQARGHPRVD